MAELNETLTPRKANRAGERLKAFKDADEDFVSATAIIGGDGKMLDFGTVDTAGKLELIYDELVKLNLHLTLLTGNNL